MAEPRARLPSPVVASVASAGGMNALSRVPALVADAYLEDTYGQVCAAIGRNGIAGWTWPE